MKLSKADYQLVRNQAKNSLYFFEKFILGYKDLDPEVHGPLCAFMQDDRFRRKQVTMPRGFLKTSTCTIGKGLWKAVNQSEIRMLIVSNVIENAAKMIQTMRHHIESNPRIQRFFPEIVPVNFNKVRWSDHCAVVRRTKEYQEGTWEAVGVGGSVISRHYDHIIEDDLIYAKKDDLTGGELLPDRDDIEKAIGWHKLATSLLIRPGEDIIDNVGTRWAPYDLISYIRKTERGWKHFDLSITKNRLLEGEPTWPGRFNRETILELHKSQGPYMFSTQYLCQPIDAGMKVFQTGWLKPYQTLPDGLRYFTTVDLAEWDDAKTGRNARKAYNVILTCGIDARRHIWIARIDRGRWTPSEVVEKIDQHCTAFKVETVGIEVVYYQKAILESVKQFFEKTGRSLGSTGIAAYTRDPKLTKDARIRGLQPIAANGCLHYREDMKEFLEEYEDYPMSRTVDILDALSDQLRIAQPPDVPDERILRDDTDIEEIVDQIKRRARSSQYPFAAQHSSEREFFSPYHN